MLTNETPGDPVTASTSDAGTSDAGTPDAGTPDAGTPGTAPVEPHPDGPRLGVLVGVLSLAVFMSSLDLFIVNLAFPSITRDFRGTSLSALSWALNGYTIVFAAALVPAGRWADRVGRRRLLVAGMVVFAVGSAACGVADGVWTLVAARLVQALGAGLMVPASLSLLLAAAPPAQRARAIGTWSAFGGLGAACGPVIGGLLVEASWRWVFWVNLPVAVVAVVLAQRLLQESRDPDAGPRPDTAGGALLAAAVGILAWGLVKAPEWGWASASFLGTVLGSVALAAATAWRSDRHPAPVVELSLLRSRTFTGAFVASILYYGGFGAFVLNSVEFLTGVWHYSPVRAGLAIGPGPVMMLIFARLVAPRLVAHRGAGWVATAGAALGAGAPLWWLVAMQTHPAYVTHLLGPQLVGGAGVGLAVPSLLGAGSATLPPHRFGAGSGVLNMARQVGTVLGVAGVVAVLARLNPHDPLATFRPGVALVAGFFAAAAVTSAALLSRRTG